MYSRDSVLSALGRESPLEAMFCRVLPSGALFSLERQSSLEAMLCRVLPSCAKASSNSLAADDGCKPIDPARESILHRADGGATRIATN